MKQSRFETAMFDPASKKDTPEMYYINQIEDKLLLLKIYPDGCKQYNDLFDTMDDKTFIQKLKVFNDKLNKLVEDLKQKAA